MKHSCFKTSCFICDGKRFNNRSETMRLGDVASLMIENSIGSVPVICEDKMRGIVSKADIITLADGIAFNKISVKEIMTKDIISVSSTERLVHARRQILESNVGRLPVVDDGELVGIITSKDLMRVYINFKKMSLKNIKSSNQRNSC